MAFKLSLTSRSLPACSLRGAAGIANVLGVGAQLATPKAAGFERPVALEYARQDYMDSLFDDVLTETIHLCDPARALEAA